MAGIDHPPITRISPPDGRPRRTTILFSPGMGRAVEDYLALAKAWASIGHPVWLIGATDRTGLTLEERIAERVAAWRRGAAQAAAQGCAVPVAAGHSLGALCALSAAEDASAVIALAPPATIDIGFGPHAFGHVRVPLLLHVGRDDAPLDRRRDWRDRTAAFRGARGPRQLIVTAKADHDAASATGRDDPPALADIIEASCAFLQGRSPLLSRRSRRLLRAEHPPRGS